MDVFEDAFEDPWGEVRLAAEVGACVGAFAGAATGGFEDPGVPAFPGAGVGPDFLGSRSREELLSYSSPSILLILSLIFLVTIIPSRIHTIAAVRHWVCQTQDTGRKAWVILQLSRNLSSLSHPRGQGAAGGRLSLSDPALPIWCLPADSCGTFCDLQSKGFWKWWVLLPVMTLPDA